MKRNAQAHWIVFFLLLVGNSLAGGNSYLQRGEIDLTKLLPPPPSQDSQQTRNEIEEILNFQKTRTKAAADYAKGDQELDVFRFSNILGPQFKKENLPITSAFFEKVVASAKVVIDPAKDFWNRPRPYIYDTLVKPCTKLPSNASYPSGHSAIGNLFAIILADMIPEKRTALFNRGWEFALNRVIGGVHYRSDVEAGRIAGSLIASKLFERTDYQNDFEKAKVEVRRALGFEEVEKVVAPRKFGVPSNIAGQR